MWEADPEVLVTDLGDELILMHPVSALMFSLNQAGRLVWQALPATAAAAAAALIDHYDVEEGQAQADAQQLLTGLAEAGLIRSP